MNMFIGCSLVALALIIMGGLLVKTNARKPCRLAPLGAFLGRLLLAVPTVLGLAVGASAIITATAIMIWGRGPLRFLLLPLAFAAWVAATWYHGRIYSRHISVPAAVPPPPPLRVLDLPLDDELSETELRMMQPPGADWATAYNLAIWPRIRESGDN